MYLKISFWNANGLQAKINEYRLYLSSERIDIAIINETKLKPAVNIKINGYVIHRKDRLHNRGGGVAILVKKNIPHSLIPSKLIEIENVSIKLMDDTIITGVYNPPTHKITNNELDELFIYNKVLLMGDLNARHATWFNRRNNRNGCTVYDFALSNNTAVLAPDTPTHFPLNNMSPTTIDILLNKNYPHPIQLHSLPLLSSDHNPIHFTIQDIQKNETTRRTFDYKTTNWAKFRKILNDKTVINNNINTRYDIDTEIDLLTRNIQHARDRTTRQIIMKPRQEIIPVDIKTLIKFKNKIKNKWQRHRRDIDRIRLNELQRNIKIKLDKHREDSWNDKIQKLTRTDNSLWKMTRLLKRPYAQLPTITHNGQVLNTDADKADALCKHLQVTNTTSPNDTAFHDNITREAQNIPSYQPIPPNKLLKLLTSPTELKKIIKTLPNNKAPGPDNLPNILLKNLPLKSLTQYTYIVNAIIRLQYFPTCWKTAIVIPVLKPRKPPHLPNSYRPISLLNTLAKVAEKVIQRIINKYINKNNLIPTFQFGFRPGHNTNLSLCKIVQDILQGYNKKQCTVMLLLDIEKAFDTVWHNGLIYKLKNHCKLPPFLVSLIKSYLFDRNIVVRVNTSLSPPRRLSAGVPQGSILSPILYNLYTSDIPAHPTTNLLLYADDTTIYGQSFYAQTATQKVRYHLDRLTDYYKKWKIKINENKTETVTFHRKFTNIKTITKLKLNDKQVKQTSTAKFLGVTLDTRLSFAPHLTDAINRAYAALSKLYPLVNRRSKLTTDNKLTIYKTILRPIMTYACVSWNIISDTQCKRLQTTQNKMLRLLTNSSRYISIAELHRLSRTQMVREYIEECSQKFLTTKIQHSTLTRNITHIRQTDNHQHKHKLLHERLPLYHTRRP